MIDKIKKFFSNGVTKIVEAVIILIAAIGLLIGGVSEEDIAKIPKFAGAFLTFIESLITFIQGFYALKKVEKTE